MKDEQEKVSGPGPESDGAPQADAPRTEVALANVTDGDGSDSTAKPGTKKSKNSKEVKKDSVFTEVSGEFKKIVWPSRRDLIKQTTTVISVALMFGVVIFLMDAVFGFGVANFVDLIIG